MVIKTCDKCMSAQVTHFNSHMVEAISDCVGLGCLQCLALPWYTTTFLSGVIARLGASGDQWAVPETMSRRTLPYCSPSSGDTLVGARVDSPRGREPLPDTEEEEKRLRRGDKERSSDEF